MGKLKPTWMKTDIPRPVKMKLWRLMKDYPNYRAWTEAIIGKDYDNPEDELLTADEARYVKMSRDTHRALRHELMHMPIEEVKSLPPDLQSFVRQLRPELEAEERHTNANADAIALTPDLERRYKTFILCRWAQLAEENIAAKLGISCEDVRRDIEETEQELADRIKEKTETREDQSIPNLPPWVNRAQEQHLEGGERQNGLEVRIDETTCSLSYGIRQKLDAFHDSFGDIDPRCVRFWIPLDRHTTTQLHGHLPDQAFWQSVEGANGFARKAKKCEVLLDAACKRFTLAGESLAPLRPSTEATAGISEYITLAWARRVLVRSLGPELGLKVADHYYHGELPDGRVELHDQNVLYVGRAHREAENSHRELVKSFSQSNDFQQIVLLMKQLRDLRQRLLSRIDECLRKGEYVLHYCSDCPALQARVLLGSQQND